jgi:hypothetical protein
MIALVKPSLFAGLCVGCLALNGGAQPPVPAPPAPPVTVIQATPSVAGQGGSYRVAPLAATAGSDGRTFYAYGFGAADAESLKLARQINDAKTDEDKEKLRGKLEDILDKAFAERQKRHEKEIEALEAQVKKLKAMVDKRGKNKREIIDERVKQLERDAAGLGW